MQAIFAETGVRFLEDFEEFTSIFELTVDPPVVDFAVVLFRVQQ